MGSSKGFGACHVTYGDDRFGACKPACGLHEFVAIGLLKMKIDGRLIFPLLIEEKCTALQRVFISAIGEAAGFRA